MNDKGDKTGGEGVKKRAKGEKNCGREIRQKEKTNREVG